MGCCLIGIWLLPEWVPTSHLWNPWEYFHWKSQWMYTNKSWPFSKINNYFLIITTMPQRVISWLGDTHIPMLGGWWYSETRHTVVMVYNWLYYLCFFFVFCCLCSAHVQYGFLCLHTCFIFGKCKPLLHDRNVYLHTTADLYYCF